MINKSLNVSTRKDVLLQRKLINVLREYFNLRIQSKLGQLKQLHLLKKTRRDAASIKYDLFNNNKDCYK